MQTPWLRYTSILMNLFPPAKVVLRNEYIWFSTFPVSLRGCSDPTNPVTHSARIPYLSRSYRVSFNSDLSVEPILYNLNILTHQCHMFASTRRVKVVDNNISDAKSHLTHLSYQLFLCHLNLTVPKQSH